MLNNNTKKKVIEIKKKLTSKKGKYVWKVAGKDIQDFETNLKRIFFR
jgi:hypothetical protein